MRTTTVVRESLEITYPDLDTSVSPDIPLTAVTLGHAGQLHATKALTFLEEFCNTHGCSSNNLVSQSDGTQRATVRSWPDLETAQAWVDAVLAGSLSEGLDHPTVIISAQVDPE
jgi:hypothetical protein